MIDDADTLRPPSGTTNEELTFANEELQRMNGKLAAAKVELQSINEKLTTLNDELQRRNQEAEGLVVEAQAARAEAERANRSKDDFLATLSHELRTPLSSILLNAQRMRDGLLVSPADLQRTGESLARATSTQVRLIDDLLDASRIVADTLTLNLGSVDLCGVVQAALDELSALSEENGLAIDWSPDPAIAPIWADPARAQQVVSNLLTNAIKFTPRGGRISVVTEVRDGFACVRVTDSGVGIAPEFLPRVFTRFSQADTSITRSHGGLGLGLALVWHLVQLQGGTAQAQSAGIGQGATFTVTFPLARESKPPPKPAPQAAPVIGPDTLGRAGRTRNYEALANLRILVVDDDLRTREAVLEVLRLTGAQVQLAASAAAGLYLVDTWNPEVVVCDISMPVEDGYAFVRKLRARETGRGTTIPALALTALATESDRRRAYAAGFQLHLAKPIDIDRLRDAVLELSTMLTVPKGTVVPCPQ